MNPSSPCNLCGSSETAPWNCPFSIVRCRSCGLIRADPLPAPEELGRLYNQGRASPLSYYALSREADRKTFHRIFQILSRVPGFPASGRLLDVGSGAGTFLECASEKGWEALGLELAQESVRYCRQRGLSVAQGTFDDLPHQVGPWDFVFMGDVIEHLRDPRRVLQGIRERLQPGGFLLISTPNIDSWAARQFQIKPQEHLYYFSASTLTRILCGTGYETVFVHRFDRHRNLAALPFSSTFQRSHGKIFSWMAAALRLLPLNLVLRFPFGENLLALARKGP
ncbi:MAG: class I SAM-dependent methyltransferase [Elusimicrobia bacterium]|nr:class I SAM-dependent methyltransferase [Elusimicrobiota bacterium]